MADKLKRKLEVGQNTGLLPPIPDEKDYILGGLSGIIHEDRNTLGNWWEFLPSNEEQKFTFFDTYGCVSYGCLNSVEIQLKFLRQSGLIRGEDWQWLHDNGYFDENGNINFDDRALVVLSNTIPGVGNTYKNVWDAARKFGLWPQGSTPFNPSFSSDRYYDKSDFPVQSYELGKEFLKRFYIQYERVPSTVDYLKKGQKHAPVQIGIPICNGYNTDKTVASCNLQAVHNVTLLNVDVSGAYQIFDSYDPFNKTLAKTYRIDFAYKGVISPTISVGGAKKERFIFTKDLQFGDYDNDVVQLGKRLIEEGFWIDTQFNPPSPHYGLEIARGVRAYQKKYGITNWWTDLIYKGRYFGPKTRLSMNGTNNNLLP